MNCGIYSILNIKTNKIYIGSSINLKSREYKHFWMLSNNRHDNLHLQKSYNKYGKECFIFNILELCEPNILADKENFYIKKYNSNNSDFGYNSSLVNEYRKNIYNNDFKIKLSRHNLKKNKNFTNFSLTNILTNEVFIFDNLIDAANYLIENEFTNGKPSYVRARLSICLRGVKVSNGTNKNTVRKTCYKHKFQIINQ